MVMGDDSSSSGFGFKTRNCILEGHEIFHIDLMLNCIVCLKKTETE